MNLYQIYELLQANIGGWALLVIVILSLIQLTPIKINPLSYIAQAIGKACNKELHNKVDAIEDKLQEMSIEVENFKKVRDEDRAINARIRILTFNDEILTRSIRHSKESFDQVMDDINFYENFCEEHEDFQNGRTPAAIDNIKRCYIKCCEDKDFL